MLLKHSFDIHVVNVCSFLDFFIFAKLPILINEEKKHITYTSYINYYLSSDCSHISVVDAAGPLIGNDVQ